MSSSGQKSQAPISTDATSAKSDESGKSSGINLWPGLLIVMLGSQMILMLVMVYMATSDLSFSVEPNYYQKALRWDEISAQRRTSTQLGWSATASVSELADIYKVRDISCLVTDKNGSPISDADVEIVAFPHARGSERLALTLDPRGRGQYHSRIKISRPGLWEFRIVVRRGDVLFEQVQEVRTRATGSVR